MIHVQLENVSMPALGFGTYLLTGSDAYRMVRSALEIGYRHIDTAQFYGNEEQVGNAIADSGVDRDEVFLTTKVWKDHCQGPILKSSVEDSLRKLRCDSIDLLLLHWPTPEVPLEETISALNAVHAEGKATLIGVSNYNSSQLRQALKLSDAPLVCNQVEYHPLLSQITLQQAMQECGVALTAYCPLARGTVLEVPVLREIGATHSKTPAQIALRWLVQQEQVAAIPKTASEERAASNFDIFDFELSEDEMSTISALGSPTGRQIDPGWVEWD